MSAPIFEGTTPLISDRYIVSMIAGESIAVGDLVEMGTDPWKVVKAGDASTKVVGVALTNASSGQRVSVVCRGIVRAKASSSGAIAAGDRVKSASGGKIVKDNTTTTIAIIGFALESIPTGGTGCILLW